jgi:hypothetical protein
VAQSIELRITLDFTSAAMARTFTSWFVWFLPAYSFATAQLQNPAGGNTFVRQVVTVPSSPQCQSPNVSL